jgi:hypothetical protein
MGQTDFFQHKKAMLMYFKEQKKNPLLNNIERELKKITIVNPQESKCRRIKLKKQINEKKILKNKTPAKPSEVAKTPE